MAFKPNVNFGASNVIDPTAGARQALQSVGGLLGDYGKRQQTTQEMLLREQGRQDALVQQDLANAHSAAVLGMQQAEEARKVDAGLRLDKQDKAVSDILTAPVELGRDSGVDLNADQTAAQMSASKLVDRINAPTEAKFQAIQKSLAAEKGEPTTDIDRIAFQKQLNTRMAGTPSQEEAINKELTTEFVNAMSAPTFLQEYQGRMNKATATGDDAIMKRIRDSLGTEVDAQAKSQAAGTKAAQDLLTKMYDNDIKLEVARTKALKDNSTKRKIGNITPNPDVLASVTSEMWGSNETEAKNFIAAMAIAGYSKDEQAYLADAANPVKGFFTSINPFNWDKISSAELGKLIPAAEAKLMGDYATGALSGESFTKAIKDLRVNSDASGFTRQKELRDKFETDYKVAGTGNPLQDMINRFDTAYTTTQAPYTNGETKKEVETSNTTSNTTSKMTTQDYLNIPSDERSANSHHTKAFALLVNEEGFAPKAKKDGSQFSGGYGSSTTTREDGTVVALKDGDTVSDADAVRDLDRRITEFTTYAKKVAGDDMWATFNDNTKAVLTSLAYNYGPAKLESNFGKYIKEGDITGLAKHMRTLTNTNGAVHNPARRKREADILLASISSGATPPADITALQKSVADSATNSRVAENYGNVRPATNTTLRDVLRDNKGISNTPFENTLPGMTAGEQELYYSMKNADNTAKVADARAQSKSTLIEYANNLTTQEGLDKEVNNAVNYVISAGGVGASKIMNSLFKNISKSQLNYKAAKILKDEAAKLTAPRLRASHRAGYKASTAEAEAIQKKVADTLQQEIEKAVKANDYSKFADKL